MQVSAVRGRPGVRSAVGVAVRSGGTFSALHSQGAVPVVRPGTYCIAGVRTFHPMQFQPMHFQPLPFQPLTISTYCIFNRSQFQPKLILANGS